MRKKKCKDELSFKGNDTVKTEKKQSQYTTKKPNYTSTIECKYEKQMT